MGNGRRSHKELGALRRESGELAHLRQDLGEPFMVESDPTLVDDLAMLAISACSLVQGANNRPRLSRAVEAKYVDAARRQAAQAEMERGFML